MYETELYLLHQVCDRCHLMTPQGDCFSCDTHERIKELWKEQILDEWEGYLHGTSTDD